METSNIEIDTFARIAISFGLAPDLHHSTPT
jgi:hypothetical protein